MDKTKNPFASDEIYGYQTLYREIGYYISRLEDYDKALKFFDEAIKKTPLDKRALTGRGRARAKTTQYMGALEDVKKVLSLDPDDLYVLADKALNIYLCCEFEEGLVENSRLLPLRQKPENFSIGVMQCTDAIENCVGDRTGRPLRDHFEIIRKLAWQKNYAAQKPFEPIASRRTKKKKFIFKQLQDQEYIVEPVQPRSILLKGKTSLQSLPELDIKDSLHSKASKKDFIPLLDKPFPFKPLQRYTSNIQNYMAEKYLDSMYLDKIFLEKLQTAAGANCPNRKGSKKIKQLAKNCHKTVSYKQELLRTRRPFYFIKYQEAKVSGTLEKRQKLELEHQQQTIKKEADSILDKMLTAYQNKKVKQFLMLVEKLKRFCDSKSKKFIPDKSTYMNEIFDKVCKAFYEVYRLNESHGLFTQNKRLYALLGLPLSREPSTDSVITEFRGVFLNYKKEIAEFEQRLKNAELPQEICWYYHELSRYHLETKKFDLARVYARKCIQTAKLINNLRWIFNCNMLILKSNVLQHNKNDAKSGVNEAMKYAEALKDEVKIKFLKRSLEAIEAIDLGEISGLKELEQRENKIVQMMASSHMKDEVAHLFRQMSALPASRRMTVIPGVMVSSVSKSKTASILPNRDSKAGSLAHSFDPKRGSSKYSNTDMNKGVQFSVSK